MSLRAQNKIKSKIYFLHMDVYAHFSCARQMETESPPRFATEVRNDWTSRNIKTRTTKIRSAHLEEVFFSFFLKKGQSEIHEEARIFPHMGSSLRDSARWDAGQIRRGCCRKKKEKKKRGRAFLRAASDESEPSSSVFALHWIKSSIKYLLLRSTLALGPPAFPP